MAYSYNVNSLPDYVEQHREELIAKSVLGAKSAYMFTLQTGVKGPTALNLIDSTIDFNPSECGWEEAGSVALSQRVLTPAALQVQMGICDKNLLKKWANYLVRVEANKTDRDLPFEKEFTDTVIKQIKAGVEYCIWQGDAGGPNRFSAEFDGILTILASASGVVNVTGTAGYDLIKKAYAAMPFVKEDAVIFVGEDMYRTYMQELVTANLYHYDPGMGENESYLPGTMVKVVGVAGLNGTNKVVAGNLSNFFYGTNLEDGDEIFDLWYSKDNREFRFVVEFTAGVQVAFPNEIVLGTV